MITINNLTLALTGSVLKLIAFGRADSFIIDEKTSASKFKATYHTFGTMTTPATKTKSIGLPTFERVVIVYPAWGWCIVT